MEDPIEKKVYRWSTEEGTDEIREINLKIHYLAEKLFYNYEPTHGAHPDFLARLERWLDNATEDSDQKTLFRLVPNLFYIGSGEFNTLYRAAYNGPIARWLIDQIGLPFNAPDAKALLDQAVRDTWFCPITDSMRISPFYHINTIPGDHAYRPDWKSLAALGDTAKIEERIKDEGIKRLVLLEDFVGSGTQMHSAVKYAATLPTKIPVLVAPLVIGPQGINRAFAIEGAYRHVKVSWVLSLRGEAFVDHAVQTGEPSLYTNIRDLVQRLYLQTSGGSPASDDEKPYGPFGFRKGGGLIVMYSNTPDNSLPIIHWRSATWEPLFPRHIRE